MLKKGEILGVPLVLVFGLIVGALILYFGTTYILKLKEEAEYIDLLDTIQDIDAMIDTYGNYDPGSSKVVSLSLPKKVEKLCFFDPTVPFECTDDGGACDSELEGTIELVQSDEFNLYLFPQGIYDMNRFAIAEFTPEEGNPVCLSNGESIVIRSQREYVGVAYYAS